MRLIWSVSNFEITLLENYENVTQVLSLWASIAKHKCRISGNNAKLDISILVIH